MRAYDHRSIEKKWQERWERADLYKIPDSVTGKDNEYILVEFPYPSGDLHVGHWYAFGVPDIYARFRRMQGKNVLYPIGFDSFGLPAENAAIKRKLDPRKWTYDNIASMTTQLRSMGNSFDWSRKIIASDPAYYRWTQWLFLKLYERGLAYKKKSSVPWCDSCKTVLANEQIIGGACERCGTQTITKELDQWYLKITDYAEKLLADLETLSWPEDIKQAQREWIGRSSGALLSFKIKNRTSNIEVFTTRPDTLYGVTYVVLAPEHQLVALLKESITNWSDVSMYIEKTALKKELERKETKEKTGVELAGVKAINPANGEEVPVWIADYVLASYGTGVVMAVPAHDERDFEFAKKYKLPIKCVIDPSDSKLGISDDDQALEDRTFIKKEILENNACYREGGKLLNSDLFDGLPNEEAKQKITEHVGGKMATQYRLRDWLISRQRYWGCPIPIVYDSAGQPHPVPEEHLPWLLPEDVDHTPTGEAPLARSREFRERTARIFGEGWTPEVDTMDTFIDSSWYFLRYLDPHNTETFSSLEKQRLWMPVTRYSGGAEHTTMHLLYSRFFYKALYDLGLVTSSEPYQARMNRSLILGPDGRKMSKSKGNVVNPDEHVQRVGADVVRAYLAFIGPYHEVGQYPWDLGGIAGIRRFLERVWELQEKVVEQEKNDSEQEDDLTIMALLHQIIKKVGDDIAEFRFNTALSQLMILANTLEKRETVSRAVYETFVQMLAPFAPHLAEEIWETIGNTTSIHLAAWPTFSETMLKKTHVTVSVQVNGKLRATCEVARDMAEHELVTYVRSLPTIAQRLTGKVIIRTIVIPNRTINFVVKVDTET